MEMATRPEFLLVRYNEVRGRGTLETALIRDLRMPAVTTFHTVLREPNDDQRRVLMELAGLYGGSLSLGTAPIGGLRAELVLPAG